MSAKADSKTVLRNRWQQLSAEEKALSGTSQHSSRSDALRNLMLQTEYARAANLISPFASSHMFHTLAETYSALVDLPDNGLNNFADGAFACVDGVRNETSQWKTSLNPDTKHNLDCVAGFLSMSKLAKASIESGARNEDPIGWSISTPSFFQHDLNDSNPKSMVPAMPTSRTDSRNLFGISTFTAGSGKLPQNKASVCRDRSNEAQWPLFSSEHGRASLVRSKPMRLEDVMPVEISDKPDNHQPNHAAFKTAREQLLIEQRTKAGYHGNASHAQLQPVTSNGTNKKSLGARRGPSGRFVPPSLNKDDQGDSHHSNFNSNPKFPMTNGTANEEPADPRLKNLDPHMIELITSEIMDHGPPLGWDDIAGLEFVKKTIKEIIIWPMLRPDIFTGLRGPPKGLLLFGPPGTGKTLIGKCIASQSKSTFFSISASSLTSKWVGESEKMVRALFAVARVQQPSVIFIDEIDSLLTHRSDGEHDSSRRIKTEFLVQLDGAATSQEDRILVVGATNRPQEIDEAARRRFVKRLYIPLPDREARKQIIGHLLLKLKHTISVGDMDQICDKTDGYSGADMANLCREAALGPIRSLPFHDIENISEDQVRPIECRDFIDALKQVRASVSDKDLNLYLEWNGQYGSWAL